MFELLKTHPKNTLRQLDHLRKNLDDFDNLFEAFSHFHGVPLLKSMKNPDFSPSLDIIEKKDKYEITCEVPGMTQKDVNIFLDEDASMVVIEGEKKKEEKKEGDDYYVCERSYGSFRREISIPKDVNQNSIEASCKNGVLTLSIPKKDPKEKQKKTKQITINDG